MPSALPQPPAFGVPLPSVVAPDVLRFLALRRSTSALTLVGPAPGADEIDDLLRLAIRVPDHGKLAPWRFVLLQGPGKLAFVQRLETLAKDRGDPGLAGKLAKLTVPPLAVAVVSSPKPGAIPEWEQILSAGAVCTNLLYGALAMGYGANWITDWYSYDPKAGEILGLSTGERIAGFVLIGTPREPPLERDRPALGPLVSHWSP